MRKTRPPKPSIHLQPVAQKTDSHCGPAVLQMLFSHLEKHVSQDEIVVAARAKKTIKTNGTRPAQLARAVERLYPDLQFWFKQRTTPAELATIVNKYRYPVAVNWQGLFYSTVAEEKNHKPSDEDGHYSVVVGINVKKDQILIADPYKDFSETPRIFSLSWFVKRWWDYAKDTNPKNGSDDSIATDQLMFVIVPKVETFPTELGMKPAAELKELKKYSRFRLFLKLQLARF